MHCVTFCQPLPTYHAWQFRTQGQHVAKQPGRHDSARSQSLRIAAYVLLVGGVVLIVTALASTATRLEAASDGLLLIGWPLLFLGAVLKGLDWVSSYTAAAEGSWDHHVNRPSGRGDEGAASGRRRAKRLRLFGNSEQPSDFGLSVPNAPVVQPLPARNGAPPSTSTSPLSTAPPAPPAPPAPVFDAEPEPEEQSFYRGRVDPGPDTVIEEFVGYEGQDRMLAVRESASPPPPRELAWPNPPRQVVDVSAAGNEAFLGKLMDDVMAKLGTSDPSSEMAAQTTAKKFEAAGAARVGQSFAAGTAPIPAPAPTPAAAFAGATARSGGRSSTTPVGSAAPSASPPAAPLVWSPRTLQAADHWRFAALVEKLYQQAGFATQLQAGQTMRGVVVLWLFSRHRPGMPASVVSCVHAPGGLLPAEEITAVADLVKARDLPRGQLATTGRVDDAGRQLAVARSVHLMDTERLLQLITQRTAEQQRALADRLA